MSKSRRFVFIGAAIIIFGYFIWPSPYIYYNFRGSTIRVDRLTGCEHIRTPAGFVTIGDDAMCFLPSEAGRRPGSYLITADPELYSEDYARDIADEVLKSTAPDMTAKSQLKVISKLGVSFELASSGPMVKVLNNTGCEIWSLTLKVPNRNGETYSSYDLDTGNLKPNEEISDRVNIDKESARIGIKITKVSFYDYNSINPLNSPCVESIITLYNFNPFEKK